MDKTDLLRYRSLSREVKQLQRQLGELEGRIYTPAGQKFCKIPNAKAAGKTMEEVVEKHMEIQNLYASKLLELKTVLLQMETAIEGLEDPAERMVLRYRYINGYDWYKIGAAMAYSERQVFRIHGTALLKLKG